MRGSSQRKRCVVDALTSCGNDAEGKGVYEGSWTRQLYRAGGSGVRGRWYRREIVVKAAGVNVGLLVEVGAYC